MFFIRASLFIFRVSSLLVSTTINTNLLCCSTNISRQECNWRHPLVSFHLLHSFSCESVFWYQKFSMPHTNCSCYKIDLIFLFLMSRMTLKTWFCMSHVYCSLFSPCRQSNIGGLLREVVQSPSSLVFKIQLNASPGNLPWPQGWPSFQPEDTLGLSCGLLSHRLSYKPLLSKFPWAWVGTSPSPQPGTDEPFLFFSP